MIMTVIFFYPYSLLSLVYKQNLKHTTLRMKIFYFCSEYFWLNLSTVVLNTTSLSLFNSYTNADVFLSIILTERKLCVSAYLSGKCVFLETKIRKAAKTSCKSSNRSLISLPLFLCPSNLLSEGYKESGTELTFLLIVELEKTEWNKKRWKEFCMCCTCTTTPLQLAVQPSLVSR